MKWSNCVYVAVVRIPGTTFADGVRGASEAARLRPGSERPIADARRSTSPLLERKLINKQIRKKKDDSEERRG